MAPSGLGRGNLGLGFSEWTCRCDFLSCYISIRLDTAPLWPLMAPALRISSKITPPLPVPHFPGARPCRGGHSGPAPLGSHVSLSTWPLPRGPGGPVRGHGRAEAQGWYRPLGAPHTRQPGYWLRVGGGGRLPSLLSPRGAPSCNCHLRVLMVNQLHSPGRARRPPRWQMALWVDTG